ncbi:DinB family protein [Actinophytocola sp. KF-1]
MTSRTEPPRAAGEREQLTGFLDFLREAVVLKATGLTDEQARKRLVPSELTTVAGLVAHLTYVEQYWFGVVLDGRPDPWRARFEQDPDAEFRAGMTTPLTELVENYVQECARSRAVVAARDLESTVERGGAPVNLRWVLIHMIEETGRHAGHLDLLRELLDGSTGE